MKITKQVIDELKSVHGDKYDYSKVDYKGSQKPIIVICHKHGEFNTTQNNHYHKKSGCPKCGSISASKKQILNTVKIIEDFKSVHGDKYNYSKVDYKGANKKVTIICPEHGEFQQTPSSHKNGQGCTKCARLKVAEILSESQETWIFKCKEIHKNKYDYSISEYKNMKSHVDILCPIHGKFSQNAHAHMRGHGCPECSKEQKSKDRMLDESIVIKQFEKVHGNKYDYSQLNYRGSKHKVNIICPNHGLFQQSPADHKNGAGCPSCNSYTSKDEDYILDKLNEMYPYMNWNRNVRGFFEQNRNFELDLLNEEHKIAIEFNGIYWHQIAKDKTKIDFEKAISARKKGYRFIALNELDINNYDKIFSLLDPYKKRVFARKCNIAKYESKYTRPFFEENHIQGNANSIIRYVLEYKGAPIQIMTFGKNRFSKNKEDWEIIRLATKKGYVVVGGAEKLFKAFLKENDPTKVISFCDNKYFDGSVYSRLGFDFDQYTGFNYVWYKNGESLKRYQTMKHKLHDVLGEEFNPEKTEDQNMIDDGWVKIQDLGNSRWVWERI